MAEKKHTDALIIKFKAVCYAVRTLKHMVPQEYYIWVIFLISILLCPTALFFSGKTHHKVSIFLE
jgi:hypothetical protein